jgi:hypothetical protein
MGTFGGAGFGGGDWEFILTAGVEFTSVAVSLTDAMVALYSIQ